MIGIYQEIKRHLESYGSGKRLITLRVEARGQFKVTHLVHERPGEADNRKVIGHWKADTILGKTHSTCLVTIVDGSSRYLLADSVQAKIKIDSRVND